MVKGLYTAYTGMINEQHRMDVLTNNLANSDTNGFKKEGATSQSFDSILVTKIKDQSEPGRLSKNVGTGNFGVKIGENYTDYSQGSFKVTNNSYDLAISGDGFFTVEFTNKAGETSTKYTRDGAFVINTEGYLVTKDGDYVLGTNGRIKLDTTKDFAVDERGVISQGGVETGNKIKLTDFMDLNYLEHYGENYYQPVEGASEKTTVGQIKQGYIETSNVQVVQEMVEMISVSRQYESNQKLITTIDESLGIASQQLGKV